jgi:uncharacterized protein (TIGR02231 family)
MKTITRPHASLYPTFSRQSYLFTMHKITFLLALLLVFGSAQAQDEKIIKPRITDVTVFLSGAQITQSTDLALKAGENRIRITDLTLYLDPNSIQVEGNNTFSIVSVRHQVNYLADGTSNPEIRAVKDSLEEAEFKKAEIYAMREVYNDEINLYRSNANIKGSDDQLLPEDLGEMATFYRTKLKEIRYKQLELNQSEKSVNELIGKLQTRLNQLNQRKGTNPSEILIVLNAEKDVRSSLRVSYVVQNAGWQPVYDLRAEDINTNIEFSYRAKVSQSTGTDWEDVNLTISTGNPTTGGQVPSLFPWYVNLYQPVLLEQENYRAGRAAEMAPSVAYDKIDVAAAPSRPGTMANYTTIVQNVVNAEFRITVPYDIPSDGQQYDVIMQRQSFKAAYAYITIPKLDNDAFLRARVTDWAQYALLPGESNIYFKGTYVGKGYIDPAMANDTLDLSLGRDKSLVVKREQIKDYCKTGMFGAKQQTTKAFEISVTNNKKQAVEVIIEDQLPISQNGDIEVEREELTGGAFDEQTGKVTWKVTVNPNETIRKQLRFNVKYPRKKFVSGL